MIAAVDTVRAASPQRVGRYLVFAPFAQGGMASVHMGRLLGSSGFSRLVAVKRLHPMFTSSEQHYKMLLEEARITSRISHPNVVPIVDVVQEPNELLLVMEYVAGVSLADLMIASDDYGDPIRPAIASAIVVDVLRGLHAAHEARSEDGALLGVVHRDVSPHNVLVGADGAARVLDFGIAKALRKDQLTASGDLKGKASYLAPEQLRGLPATRQTDIFAVGIVLWEALTGKRLFDGEPATAMLRILEETPAAPSTQVASLPRSVDRIVMRALAREPRERFATCEEMALELIDAVAPATREDVARYVQTVASDELDRRQNLAREAERASTPTIATPPSSFPAAASGVVVARAPTTPSRARRNVALGAVSAIVIALGAAYGTREPKRPALSTSTPTPNISVRSAAPAARSTDMSTGPEGTLVTPTPTPSATATATATASTAPLRTKAPSRKADPKPIAPEDSTAATDRR